VLCHSAGVKFDLHGQGATSSKLVAACCRANDARMALSLLNNARKWRLKPAASSVLRLVEFGGRVGDVDLVLSALTLFKSRAYEMKAKHLHIIFKCERVCALGLGWRW